jgi:4-hydroxy-3-methylbut-2-en-1-yl diphosphate synthase IspG/GcpE
VVIGHIVIGDANDIPRHSMTNGPTKNIERNVRQICELFECECDIMRLTVTDMEDVIFYRNQNLSAR